MDERDLMEYNRLGNTDLIVSKLCFGGLTIGPLQANLSPEEGGRIIARAMEEGVNFIDTADLYNTYPHIRKALEYNKNQLIIASKSYDYERSGAEKSFLKALTQLNRLPRYLYASRTRKLVTIQVTGRLWTTRAKRKGFGAYPLEAVRATYTRDRCNTPNNQCEWCRYW